MGTMNISIPDSLKSYVDDQVESRGYGTHSEFVRDLIRKDKAIQELRRLIGEGLESELGPPVDQAWFDSLRMRQ